jgi:hypothetical protein
LTLVLLLFYKECFRRRRVGSIFLYNRFTYLFQDVSPILILLHYFVRVLVPQQSIHNLILLPFHFILYTLDSNLVQNFAVLCVGYHTHHLFRAVASRVLLVLEMSVDVVGQALRFLLLVVE